MGENRDVDAERRAENLLGEGYGLTGNAKIDEQRERQSLHIQDQESVRDHLEEWASKFECRDGADRKAVSEYLEKLQQPDMKPADLVKASDGFLEDVASRGIPEVRESAPGTTHYTDYMLQKISVATEAFASYKDVKVDDKDLFHKFLVSGNEIEAQGSTTPPGPAYGELSNAPAASQFIRNPQIDSQRPSTMPILKP